MMNTVAKWHFVAIAILGLCCEISLLYSKSFSQFGWLDFMKLAVYGHAIGGGIGVVVMEVIERRRLADER